MKEFIGVRKPKSYNRDRHHFWTLWIIHVQHFAITFIQLQHVIGSILRYVWNINYEGNKIFTLGLLGFKVDKHFWRMTFLWKYYQASFGKFVQCIAIDNKTWMVVYRRGHRILPRIVVEFTTIMKVKLFYSVFSANTTLVATRPISFLLLTVATKTSCTFWTNGIMFSVFLRLTVHDIVWIHLDR